MDISFRRFRRQAWGLSLADVLLAILVLAALAAVAAYFLSRPETIVTGFAAVTDGDTIRIGGAPIRLEGLDAPELHQTCTRDGQPYPCGEAARREVIRLTAGAPVTCRISGRDRYDRDLARCAVRGEDIGETLVAQGLAVAYGRRSPYRDAEDRARRERRGLWAGEFQMPSDWRKAHPRR